MPTHPTASPPVADAAAIVYARPLGQQLKGKFHRFPLVVAGIAIASLLWPLAEADAAVIDAPGQSSAVAAQSGLEPALQQREGRRGGGGGGQFRGNRGGGEGRAQLRNNAGSARIENRQQFRQERRADRQEFRQERRGDVQGFRQERRGDVQAFRAERRDDRQDFRQDRRGDRQDFRQGIVTRPEFRAERRDDRRDFRVDRRDDRQDFRRDRRLDNRDFRADRRDDRRDFRQDRRFDNRDFRNDRRNLGFNNRGFDNRSFNNRGFNDRNWGGGWNTGWRNDRRYNWYGYRDQNRNFFRAGRYFPPVRGWGYRRIGIGFTLGSPFFASSFWINDPWAYRLPPAYGQLRWVRYFGDVLLVDVYTGQVVDVVNDFFW